MIQISDLDAQAFLRGLYQAEEVDKDVAQAIYKRHRKEGVDLVRVLGEGGLPFDVGDFIFFFGLLKLSR